MEEADDKMEKTEEELKAKTNTETAAEAEEAKRLALQVKHETGGGKIIVAEETERQAEAMGDMNETKKKQAHTR